MENMQLQGGQNYNVSVSGKIRFFSGFPEFTNRGVYRNGVVLWFRNSSDPGTWFHPVPGNIQGTHFDKLDADGNFSFSFSFTGDLSGYDEMIVLVNASNNAAFMPAPEDGYVVWFDNGYTAFYHESDGIIASINPSQTTITVTQNNNNFPPDQGKIYRHLQQSKEYVEQLYGGNVPFDLPPIFTRVYDLSGLSVPAAGVFCSTSNCNELPAQSFGPFIFIDPITGSQIKTISHEYGHKTNFRMWNSSTSKMGEAALSLIEGWAEFFSFGLRNHANRNFGDDLLSNRTNAEEAPFEENNRYSGFSFLLTDRNVAAFGSYLWSLYDDPVDDSFLAPQYSIGDNDDISGQSIRVFEKMRTLGTTTINNYHNHYKSGLPSDEQTSVNKVWNFMFDDLEAIPSSKMLSAQVDNFNGTINSGSIDFTWQPKSYPSSVSFANKEIGYRLFKDSGSGFQQLATIPEGTTNFTYQSSNLFGDYKITSYNKDGNSSGALVFSNQQPDPLFVTISGPTELQSSQFANYFALVSGGDEPFSYQWEAQIGSNPWQPVGFDSDSYTHLATEDFCLTVIVTDFNDDSSQGFRCVTVNDDPGFGFSEVIDLPNDFSLDGNYPNPFNPVTTIEFALPEASDVTLEVFNIMGQKVSTLVNERRTAGFHSVQWDASRFSSGTYFLRMAATGASGESFENTGRMTLIK